MRPPALLGMWLTLAGCGARSSLTEAQRTLVAAGAGGAADAGAGGAPQGGSGGAAPAATCVPGEGPVVLSPAANAMHLAIDDTRIYWTEFAGKVRSVPKAGGEPTTLVEGQSFPLGIALDATHVVFTDRDQGSVLRVPKAGGKVDAIWVGPPEIWPMAVAVDESAAYWVTMIPGSVGKAATSGGPPEWTLGSPVSQPEAIALDATHVYWTDFSAGRVMRVAKAGGEPETLAAGAPGYSALAVDEERVYVADRSAGNLLAIPIGGGAATTLASGKVDLDAVAVDASRVYFTSGIGEPGDRFYAFVAKSS